MLLAGLGSVRIVKNCEGGLENAALGLCPRAAFSRARSQFLHARPMLDSPQGDIFVAHSRGLTGNRCLYYFLFLKNISYLTSYCFGVKYKIKKIMWKESDK